MIMHPRPRTVILTLLFSDTLKAALDPYSRDREEEDAFLLSAAQGFARHNLEGKATVEGTPRITSASFAFYTDEALESLRAWVDEQCTSTFTRTYLSGEHYHQIPPRHRLAVDPEGKTHLIAQLSTSHVLWLAPAEEGAYRARVVERAYEGCDLVCLERAARKPTAEQPFYPGPRWEYVVPAGQPSIQHATRAAMRRLEMSLPKYPDRELLYAIESSVGVATPNEHYAKVIDYYESRGAAHRRIWMSRSLLRYDEVMGLDGERVFPDHTLNAYHVRDKQDLAQRGCTLVVLYSSIGNPSPWSYELWDEHGQTLLYVQGAQPPAPDMPLFRVRPDLFRGDKR